MMATAIGWIWAAIVLAGGAEMAGAQMPGMLPATAPSVQPVMEPTGVAAAAMAIASLVGEGTDYAATSASFPASQTAVTFEAWIRATTLVNDGAIVSVYNSSGNAIRLKLGGSTNSDGGSNDVSVTVRNGTTPFGYTATNWVQTGVWYHVALVFDGSQATNAAKLLLYVNGVARSLSFTTGTVPTSTSSNTAPVYVLARTSSGTDGFVGDVTGVRTFTAARTEAQIKADMVTYALASKTGVWSEYPMAVEVGTSTSDVSGNTRHLVHGSGSNTPTRGSWMIGQSGVK